MSEPLLPCGVRLASILALPGLTAAHLLHWAEEFEAIAAAIDARGEREPLPDPRSVRAAAAALREAAPRFPTPPLIPANAAEAGHA